MERGTEREREAVRERWAALERQQASATRLLGGLTLVSGGVAVLLLAAVTDVCDTAPEGAVVGCTSVVRSPIAVALALVGVAAFAAGARACLLAIRESR